MVLPRFRGHLKRGGVAVVTCPPSVDTPKGEIWGLSGVGPFDKLRQILSWRQIS